MLPVCYDVNVRRFGLLLLIPALVLVSCSRPFAASPTPTPTPKPTATPKPTPTPAATGSVSSLYTTYSVLKHVVLANGDPVNVYPPHPKPGYVFVLIYLRFKNRAATKNYYSAGELQAKDNQGRVFDQSLGLGKDETNGNKYPPLGTGTFLPGQAVQGWSGYEIPKTSRVLTIQIQDVPGAPPPIATFKI